METKKSQYDYIDMPITVYYASIFGIAKSEGKLKKYGRTDYAQYKNCPFVHWVPKGKRKPMGHTGTYDPWMVVIAGHNHIEPPSGFTEVILNGSGLACSHSRFSSFDRQYKTEFDAAMDAYIMDKMVLVDCRATVQIDFVANDLPHPLDVLPAL